MLGMVELFFGNCQRSVKHISRTIDTAKECRNSYNIFRRWSIKYVVVVDDEELVEEFLEEFLREADYGEKSFSDPEEAFDFIKENREEVALVVADVSMPCMTGAQLGEELMKVAPAIPLIILTGHAVLPLVEDLSNNVKIVLQKPLIRKEFLRAIKTLIGPGNDVE
jgi:two-component system response regulator FixJ